MQHTIDQHVSRIVYSPSPGSYAVIRMNPVEMVRHLDDPQALLEAQAMRPKSYLVYLVYVRLPTPSLIQRNSCRADDRFVGVGATIPGPTVVQI